MIYGHASVKIRLIWHFRNQEKESTFNSGKRRSKFNPTRKNDSIEIYLSGLEEETLAIDDSIPNYPNLIKEKRNAMYSLRDDKSIIVKEVEKGSKVYQGL